MEGVGYELAPATKKLAKEAKDAGRPPASSPPVTRFVARHARHRGAFLELNRTREVSTAWRNAVKTTREFLRARVRARLQARLPNRDTLYACRPINSTAQTQPLRRRRAHTTAPDKEWAAHSDWAVREGPCASRRARHRVEHREYQALLARHVEAGARLRARHQVAAQKLEEAFPFVETPDFSFPSERSTRSRPTQNGEATIPMDRLLAARPSANNARRRGCRARRLQGRAGRQAGRGSIR